MGQVNIAGQQAQINTLFADNSNEDITPLDERTIALNVTDSVPFLNDVATVTGIWTHDVVVKGVTPVAGEDLATKAYVDANAGVAAGDVIGQDSSFDTELVVFSGTNGKLIDGGTGVRVATNGDFTGLGDLSFSTATKLIGTVAVGNIGDITASVNVTGAWNFDDITVPVPTSDLHAATKKYVDDNIGSGDVGVSGTPVDNQLAIWTGASTIEGDANLTWNNSTNTFAIGGTLSINDLTIDNIVIDGNDISTTSGDLTFSAFTGNVTSTTFNSVPLTAAGSATDFLAADGTYTTIAGGGDVLSSGTPVDNQIAVWTNANTIEGTTGLTYTGTAFNALVDTITLGSTNTLTIDTSNSGYSRIYGDTRLILDGDYSGSVEGVTSTTLSAYWDGYKISEIQMQTGDDTVNKDNGVIQFRTAPNSSSIQIAGQIESDQSWNFYGNTLYSIDDILRGVDNTRLNISGGSTSTLGANLSLTGNSDPSNVDSVIFRIDSTDTLVIDGSGDSTFGGDVTIEKTGDATLTLKSGSLLADKPVIDLYKDTRYDWSIGSGGDVNDNFEIRDISSSNETSWERGTGRMTAKAAAAANYVLEIENTTASFGDRCLKTKMTGGTFNTNSWHLVCEAAGVNSLYIYGNGTVLNSTGTYGIFSDRKLKDNIKDASSQWDDIAAVRLRRYTLKNDESETVQLGVIAQELEESGMNGLIQENADIKEVKIIDKEGREVIERKELGTTTKAVKSSILQMKALGALQENMKRTVSLEEENKSLIKRTEKLDKRIEKLEKRLDEASI
jgi:hypothetical protein